MNEKVVIGFRVGEAQETSLGRYGKMRVKMLKTVLSKDTLCASNNAKKALDLGGRWGSKWEDKGKGEKTGEREKWLRRKRKPRVSYSRKVAKKWNLIQKGLGGKDLGDL